MSSMKGSNVKTNVKLFMTYRQVSQREKGRFPTNFTSLEAISALILFNFPNITQVFPISGHELELIKVRKVLNEGFTIG